ncbi:lipase secretion chaperone [Photobacterium lipolyticum]|uniref:Lipase chaperone n=1 Tax=Photobacterium lipolyticum TaxID=266810 RepID=A0A2T3N367_9GAMM|nr:lipase secretion chaperone [Photobacterium lipolyticum]PSW06811.1 lipase chaperone [Photobacterium lipolyticum]
MKKTTLATVGVIGLLVGVVLLCDLSSTDKPEVQVRSQGDTTVDNESPKDLFEYMLSGLGESDLPGIEANFKTYSELNRNIMFEQGINEALFKKYLAYKQALLELAPQYTDVDLNSLSQLHQLLLAVQQQIFTSEEIKRIFSDENMLRELAIIKLTITQQAESPEQIYEQWQAELDNLSPNIKEAFSNAALLGSIQQTTTLDSQERFLVRQELVGQEAAARLEALDQQRVIFNMKVKDYLAERLSIIENTSLDNEMKVSSINELRRQWFDDKLQKRVQALEKISDSKVVTRE